jgi:two-component system, response regulator PdtaR
MNILIADDESIIRLGLKSMLQEMGHQVLTAANGREALEQARRHNPELVILDIKMPLTDGLQAAAALQRARPVPVLLLTAFSDRELVEKATDLPIQGYLVKPVRPEELAAAISLASKRFAEQQALKEQAAELEKSLASRKLVERAKGKLMAAGLSEEAAYQSIQRQAREKRQSMSQVAEAILKQEQPIS